MDTERVHNDEIESTELDHLALLKYLSSLATFQTELTAISSYYLGVQPGRMEIEARLLIKFVFPHQRM